MSQSTNLYLNTRWGLNDIKTVIERMQGPVTIESHHSFAPGYFTFHFRTRMMHVHTDSHTPIGTAVLLSLHADEEGRAILKGIAEVFGGIYEDNDCDGKCEFIVGAMDEGDALPYFLKYAIICDGIDPDDMAAFQRSHTALETRIGR